MRYSYEFKRKCIEMYRKGIYPETPKGIKTNSFHYMIREWSRTEESCGPEALKHKGHNRVWTADERYELVSRVLAGESIASTAISAGMNHELLRIWVHKFQDSGYNGLENLRRGRRPKDPKMKKPEQHKPRKINESEYEELIRLRAEVQYLKAENEVIKKKMALREAKWDAQRRAKKRRSSRDSGKKDTR